MPKTIDTKQKLTPRSPTLRPPHNCSTRFAQAAQLPQSPVQPKQAKNQSFAQKLSNFVNRAQCLARPVSKKQQGKQPKTKTVDIETQWQKPLAQTKNWLSEVVYRLNYTAHCTMLNNESASLYNGVQ
jgi:hypothetical protein